jgi:cation transporter-like permease
MWVVLFVGGVEVVGFTYLFGLESTTVHVLMVASLTFVIALVLFTIAALDYPFKGDIRIDPDAFEQVLGRFESSKPSDL